MVNSYFDFDDYSSPVKTYLDDRILTGLLPGYVKSSWVYIRYVLVSYI
jgi:hypothetical protein